MEKSHHLLSSRRRDYTAKWENEWKTPHSEPRNESIVEYQEAHKSKVCWNPTSWAGILYAVKSGHSWNDQIVLLEISSADSGGRMSGQFSISQITSSVTAVSDFFNASSSKGKLNRHATKPWDLRNSKTARRLMLNMTNTTSWIKPI